MSFVNIRISLANRLEPFDSPILHPLKQMLEDFTLCR